MVARGLHGAGVGGLGLFRHRLRDGAALAARPQRALIHLRKHGKAQLSLRSADSQAPKLVSRSGEARDAGGLAAAAPGPGCFA
eukprot:7002849-Pyramimonas_sp.AAC.1